MALTALGSASIGGAFPPPNFEGYNNGEDVYCLDSSDGHWDVNVADAIVRCREVVEDDSDIVLDIILRGCIGMPHYTVSKSAYDNLQTHKSIKGWHANNGKIFTILEAFPDIELRHMICPSEGLHGDHHAI